MSRENLNKLVQELRKLPMGGRAALRRMDLGDPGKAATTLYPVLVAAGIETDDVDRVRRWSLLAHSLALADFAQSTEFHVGQALVNIGFSEARLNQLLAADREVLADLLPMLARRLGAKSQPMDWMPIVNLILSIDRDQERTDEARLSIARSFVIASHKAEKTS